MHSDVIIQIDDNSGFCFGVVNAIQRAEESLASMPRLYCLGDIVHNTHEMKRLAALGLVSINHAELKRLSQVPVLLRAHGEPPSTYHTAKQNNIRIIDASCPVVLRLQRKIKEAYETNPNRQIVIYGKQGHAEVNGLVGQTQGSAIVVENLNDISKIDKNKDLILFAQTTKSVDGFKKLTAAIQQWKQPDIKFEYQDTICRQVANRMVNIRNFASKFDLVFFVSDNKSSNGKILFEACKKVNPNVHFISSSKNINANLLSKAKKIGICGATSTPKWLMENVAEAIKNKLKYE